MNTKNVLSVPVRIVAVIVMLLTLTGCGTVRKVVDTGKEVAVEGGEEYNELIRLWQNAQKAGSNFYLTTDTQYAKIQASTSQADTYYESITQQGEVWSGNFRAESEAMAELLNAYRDEDGNLMNPNNLDLAALQEQGALPDGLGQGFMLYVSAIQQAAPPQSDSAVTLALMDTTNEGMDTIQLAGTDWNDAVFEYNTRRSQIKGEIVAAVSDYLGYELPETLPFYQGGNTGPISNPIGD